MKLIKPYDLGKSLNCQEGFEMEFMVRVYWNEYCIKTLKENTEKGARKQAIKYTKKDYDVLVTTNNNSYLNRDGISKTGNLWEPCL